MKAIIFDFGGTLDTNGIHWSEFFWDVYKKFNVNVSKAEYERAYVEGENDFIPLTPFSRKGGISASLRKGGKGSFRDVLFQQLVNQFKYLPDVRIIPLAPFSRKGGISASLRKEGKEESGNKLIEKMADYCYNVVKPNLRNSKELLSSLHKNFKLGIISNFYGNMASVCREFGIDEFLDVIIDSAIAGISKPDPAIFKLALKELNLNAADCMMVGDSYSKDIAPAKSVGFTTVWLKGRSWNEPEDSSQADFVIGSLEEIKKLVKTTPFVPLY